MQSFIHIQTEGEGRNSTLSITNTTEGRGDSYSYFFFKKALKKLNMKLVVGMQQSFV